MHPKLLEDKFLEKEARKLGDIKSSKPFLSLVLPEAKKGIRIYDGPAKSESSLATQIHTENIGLADFHYRQRVLTPAYTCRRRRKTAKQITHVLSTLRREQ